MSSQRVRRLHRCVVVALVVVSGVVPATARADDLDDPDDPGVAAVERAARGGGTDDPLAATRRLLADGWDLRVGPEGPELRWTPPAPLPIGGARAEFRQGGVVLGHPRTADDGTLVLPVTPTAIEAPEVWYGGRRLDVPAPAPADPVADADRAGPLVDERTLLEVPTDPGVRGPYTVGVDQYALDPVTLAGLPVPVEVEAEVRAPLDAPGRRPVVVFLHGRHATCHEASAVSLDWPCPPGSSPVPSHRGFGYLTDLLASQGFVTISISANGVNAQDDALPDGGAGARAALVAHHLGLWASWNAAPGGPFADEFTGRLDLDRVVLVGHSRGGEGVVRAAIEAATTETPYQVVGLGLIAPTAFGRQIAPNLPTMVLLPYCDGDVADLQGQQYVDDSALLVRSRAIRSSVLVLGANHNFFNTEWTPGPAVAPADDDWGFIGEPNDPVCGRWAKARLRPAAQRAAGATYVAALVRVATVRDRSAALLLDGSPYRARSVGTASVLVHALGGRHNLLYRPRRGDGGVLAGATARACRGYRLAVVGFTSPCDPDAGPDQIPHWVPMGGLEVVPGPWALAVSWERPGVVASLPLPVTRDLRAASHVDLRMIATDATGVVLRLVDETGATADLVADRGLLALPGSSAPLAKRWAQVVRFDLGASAGVDLARIVRVEVLVDAPSGTAWLLDLYARRGGVPLLEPMVLPRIDVPDLEVVEGDTERRVELVLPVSGRVGRHSSILVSVVPPRGVGIVEEVRLPRGATSVQVPLTVFGNERFDFDTLHYDVIVAASSMIVTGDPVGEVIVTEDDPAPQLSFTAVQGSVREGQTLLLRATLTSPLPTDLYYPLSLLDPATGRRFDSADVSASFLRYWSGYVPDTATPLGEVVFPYLSFPAGSTVAEFEIPIATDGRAEGTERLTVRLDGFGDPIVPAPLSIEVVVRD